MVGNTDIHTCPLCLHSAGLWIEHELRFYRCSNCKLVFKHSSAQLTPALEKARYDQHNNDPLDPRYTDFLGKLLLPLSTMLPAHAKGLDFGCGPSKAAEQVLSKLGFCAKSYDPFYFPEAALLTEQYDFICCSEVFEHFFNPHREINLLNSCLRPGAILAVMTSPYPAREDFPSWYYWRDPTHVCFYALETFEYIAKTFTWSLTQKSETTFYFTKSAIV